MGDGTQPTCRKCESRKPPQRRKACVSRSWVSGVDGSRVLSKFECNGPPACTGGTLKRHERSERPQKSFRRALAAITWVWRPGRANRRTAWRESRGDTTHFEVKAHRSPSTGNPMRPSETCMRLRGFKWV